MSNYRYNNSINSINYRYIYQIRFYFLKLIPRVPNGALLDTEPYAQMDFYFRAMSGAFINPYSLKLDLYNQTSSLNWKFSEIASRSSEEDPTLFDYVDPREITS